MLHLVLEETSSVLAACLEDKSSTLLQVNFYSPEIDKLYSNALTVICLAPDLAHVL